MAAIISENIAQHGIWKALQEMAGVMGRNANRVESMTDDEISTGPVIDAVGIPTYVDDVTQYPDFNLQETGWYIFARIFAKDTVLVTDETTVEGAAYTASAGDDHVCVAVRFDGAAVSQKVTVKWGAYTESFIFKATDLAARNQECRVASKAAEATQGAETATAKAQEASTSATEAGQSATSASESATAAATSASDAAGSATAASQSAEQLSSAVTQVEANTADISNLKQNIKTFVGSPLVASAAAEMTDTTRVYVYVGSETGYTFGNWYYYDGTSWVSGGVYNATAVNTDKTLTQEDQPADAKKTGDEITDLKQDLSDITDTQTAVGKNLFNPQYLTDATDWVENDGVYSGNLTNLIASYGLTQDGYPFAVMFKENTRYTFSCQAYTLNEKAGSSLGIIIKFEYTDSTTSQAGIPNSTNSFAPFSVTSSANKTISKIGFIYGSKPANVWYLKEIQLEEGTEATEYEAYGQSATITTIKKNAIDGYESMENDVSKLNGIYEKGYITGKNKFDPQYLLDGTEWTETNGVYSGILNKLLSKYGIASTGYPIHAIFKDGVRYTFSCKGYTTNTASGTGFGLMVQFNYSDGTNSSAGISNSTNSFADFHLSSSAGKTVTSIVFKYGSKPENTWFLKEIQLEEGTEASEYATYTETVYDALKPSAIQNASITMDKLAFQVNRGFVTNSFPAMLFTIDKTCSDMTYVVDELWAFGSSADDHSSYAGINRIEINYEEGTYTSSRLYHNWGHINSIDYSRGADALLTSNAGQSTTDEGIIYIIQNVSAIKAMAAETQAPFADYVLQIDCSGLDLGYKFQLCWGESNYGRFDIAYLLTSDMKTIRRIQLGKGSNALTYGTAVSGATDNQFNGTFEILNTFQTNVQMQNNGTAYKGGCIYAVGDHTAMNLLRFTLDTDNGLRVDVFAEKCRDAAGSAVTRYGEGVALSGNHMACGLGGTSIGIFEI